MADKIDEDALRFGQMLQSYREGANVVSRTINAVSVPQSTQKKYKYVLSFKDAVTLVRKYFRLHAHEPLDRIYAELLGYTRPVVSERADKRNMKPKSAVWFVYRVA